jgi:lysyl-tRNA synthetase class 2
LDQTRAFFAKRNVLEVELPLLGQTTVTDLHIDSFSVPLEPWANQDKPTQLFLQTSPEFAMKRLLAAGSGPVYSLAKAFRRGEQGTRHNPEFTLLEWYRPGFDEHQLMAEVAELLMTLLTINKPEKISYAELFEQHCGMNPHSASTEQLQKLALSRLDLEPSNYDKSTWLDLIFCQLIEPALKQIPALFVYDYPACQAALAKLHKDQQGQQVAARFELFVQGMELANGYFELTDASEQKQRFQADLAQRQARKLDCPPLDQRLIDALASGMPATAGVALGFDRLVMLATGAECIQQVLAFSLDRA